MALQRHRSSRTRFGRRHCVGIRATGGLPLPVGGSRFRYLGRKAQRGKRYRGLELPNAILMSDTHRQRVANQVAWLEVNQLESRRVRRCGVHSSEENQGVTWYIRSVGISESAIKRRYEVTALFFSVHVDISISIWIVLKKICGLGVAETHLGSSGGCIFNVSTFIGRVWWMLQKFPRKGEVVTASEQWQSTCGDENVGWISNFPCSLARSISSHSMKTLAKRLLQSNNSHYFTNTLLFDPFTPKNDQFRISPAASPVILHHTVWRTWLFVAYSDERWLY